MHLAIVFILMPAALAYMLLLGHAMTRPRTAANLCFMAVLALSALWVVTYFTELFLPDIREKTALRIFRSAALAWLPMSLLGMIAHFFGIGERIPRVLWRLVLVINVFWTLFIATNSLHGLFIGDHGISQFGPVGILTFRNRPLGYAFHHFQHLLTLLPLPMLLTEIRRSTGRRRQNILLVLAGISAPLLLNFLFMEGLAVYPGLNLAPFSTVLSTAAFSWVLLRNRGLDLVPLARSLLIDQIPDPVLVTDLQGRAADLNQPFADLLGLPRDSLLGKTIAALPPPWPEALSRVDEPVPASAGEKWLERSDRPIEGPDGSPVGTLILFRDVTARIQRESARVEMERALANNRAMRQRDALLRDLHDGLGGVSASIALLANLGGSEENPETKNSLLKGIETLAAEGNAELRGIMNALEYGERPWTDWIEEIRKFGETIADAHRIEFRFHKEGKAPETPLPLPISVSLFRMFKEALLNAVRHAAPASVALLLRFQPDGLEIRVDDDGHGFDPATARPGRGLRNMRRRAEELGGSLTLQSRPGTQCRFRIPLPVSSPDPSAFPAP